MIEHVPPCLVVLNVNDLPRHRRRHCRVVDAPRCGTLRAHGGVQCYSCQPVGDLQRSRIANDLTGPDVDDCRDVHQPRCRAV
jgi:hypothetical protein